MKIETVTILHQPPKKLFGMKKVRFGGGLKDRESPDECSIRETFEETRGIRIIKQERLGEILFHFENDEPEHLVYFFRAYEFEGVPAESDEMKPEWFEEKDIPYEKMLVDDKYWLSLLLERKKFKGQFYFDRECKIKDYQFKEII